jgi:hypothetical protein
VPQRLVFFGTPVEADLPLVDTAGVVAGSFFFGFRISRLLRLCPLAMMFSCMNPIRRCGRLETKRSRCLDEARDHQSAKRLIKHYAAASFVLGRQSIQRPGGSMLTVDGLEGYTPTAL